MREKIENLLAEKIRDRESLLKDWENKPYLDVLSQQSFGIECDTLDVEIKLLKEILQ